MMVTREARDDEDVLEVRKLLEEYRAALGIDLCFQGFASELANLPGDYAPPAGRLFLAYYYAMPAACAGLRPLTDGHCEMKRLFVRPVYRSQGLGRALATRLIQEAKGIGYLRACIDTLPSMLEAQKLYDSLGFREVAPYYDNPIPGARYLALDL
ncbi:MAG: GNAT family N-acetyltransferase [Chromatiales bacterium]